MKKSKRKKAAKKTYKINPPARLEPRDGDEELTLAQLSDISLFESLNEPVDLGKFPGYVILRRYDPENDGVIFRQNEPGWTAFYILTREDLRELRISQLEQEEAKSPQDTERVEWLKGEVAKLDKESATPQSANGDLESQRAAKVRVLPEPASPIKPAKGIFGWLSQFWREEPEEKEVGWIYEGELFGEMSCQHRMPRSATIEVVREVYVLEMLRNIYQLLMKDDTFLQRIESIYKQRVLGLHLRGHRLFDSFSQDPAPTDEGLDLSDSQFLQKTLRELPTPEFDQLRGKILSRAEIVTKKAGEVIFDEFERADCFYIICSGYVRVFKHISNMVRAEEIGDWQKLCRALANLPVDCEQDNEGQADDEQDKESQADNEGDNESQADNERDNEGQDPFIAGLKQEVWDDLKAVHSELMRGSSGQTLSEMEKDAIVDAINRVIAKSALHVKVKFVDQPASSPSARIAKGKTSSHSAEIVHDLDVLEPLTKDQANRYRNRLVLQWLYGACFPEDTPEGIPRPIGYRSEGNFLGANGLLAKDHLRTETCLAYAHPLKDRRTEARLLKIDADVFDDLRRQDSHFRSIIKEEQRRRREQHDKVVAAQFSREPERTIYSERFGELGLIQGQALMLIDLNRCTRCDECVEACINTHDTPREGLSRLFLSGPSIGHFLVPATCRQCTDPVCLNDCPVAAIHKGDHGQIVIEDWCIGCTRCAQYCPYEAIQMRPIGGLPRCDPRWRYMPAAALPEDLPWFDEEFDDEFWPTGQPPFYYDLEFRSTLRQLIVEERPNDDEPPEENTAGGDAICYRSTIELPEETMVGAEKFLLQIESASETIDAWFNGQPLDLEAGKFNNLQKKWNRQAFIDVETNGVRHSQGSKQEPKVRVGRNTLAVRIAPAADPAAVLFDAGLYHYKQPDVQIVELGVEEKTDLREELRMDQAVVCDLCVSLPSGTPACVAACPHDAAWRGHPLDPDSPLRRR